MDCIRALALCHPVSDRQMTWSLARQSVPPAPTPSAHQMARRPLRVYSRSREPKGTESSIRTPRNAGQRWNVM